MDEEEKVYAIRLSRPAARAIVSEHSRMEAVGGSAAADQWKVGLMAAIRSLATLPGRCAVAPESALFPEDAVRQLLYQRRRGGPAWRILFTVHEADESDPPIVWVQLVRHGSQSPLTEWPGDEEDGGEAGEEL